MEFWRRKKQQVLEGSDEKPAAEGRRDGSGTAFSAVIAQVAQPPAAEHPLATGSPASGSLAAEAPSDDGGGS